MQLTRLDIKGFKSFGDKITINFDKGITAIVGPNGCGKSNVVDSIRWVLGEQSTRMLRSEKMENIIFNGSKSRKPANLAEVSLTFDNTRNILPTAFSQVTITRKLYRTGESEYRLNDVQCRLKDITDLFLDTGIGADSYSIIELKMIDEIIINKENSRRNLFEEASGISKYKLRKKQTFNKLKDTEADLARVDDLLIEIEKNLKTLENQAKKADRYNKIKAQYKSLSVTLASFRIAAFSTSLSKIESREQQQKLESIGIAAQIDTFEAGLQKQKLDSLTNEKNLSLQQKVTNDFIGKIRNYESEKKVRNEKLKYQKDKEKQLTEDLDRDRTQQNHVLYNIKRLTEEHTTESGLLTTQTSKLALLKETADNLRLSQSGYRDEVNTANTHNNNLRDEIYKIEKEIDILKIQQQSLEQESLRNMEDAAGKETELSQFNYRIAELAARIETLYKEHKIAAEYQTELQIKIEHSNQEIITINSFINKENRRLDAKQNEFTLTKGMVDSLEGFPESIRFLKNAAGWSKSPLLFSDVLFCHEEYRIAIENYLEPVMNYYVVNNYKEALQAINLLSESSRGRAQFFILNSYKSVTPTVLSANAYHISALDVVTVDERYKALCSHLLKNVFLTDATIETEFNSTSDDDIIVIAKNGKFNLTAHTAAGGSVGLFEGKRIGRAKNLDNLAKEIKGIETVISKANTGLTRWQNELSGLKVLVNADEPLRQQQQLNQLNTELITLKTRQEQYRAFINNSRNRKHDIADKIVAITNEIAHAAPKLAQLKTEKLQQENALQINQAKLNEISDRVNAESATYNQENILYHQQQNRVASLVKDLQYREVQLESINSRIVQNDALLANLKTDIKQTLLQTDHTDDDLLNLYKQREEMEAGVKQAEELYYASRNSITETENEIGLLRKKKEQATYIENELKDERNNLKLELNALKERLSVEFNVAIEDLLDVAPPETETEQSLKEKTDKLKRQLDDYGAINPMAIEAYDEMNERFTFINSQKKDLLEAKASLMDTIQEIDDTAREKFMSAFISVRENFIKVFRSLFNEEDSCDLLLTDPTHPLESDIDIVAKPKGKRPLSINQLSGGEKTLTATAILFSLYLLKPAPFCIFDEVDAPLDDTNIDKFNNIIRKFSTDSQFIIVSHNKRTIASTDIIYGVTMVEQGISRVVPVDMRQLA